MSRPFAFVLAIVAAVALAGGGFVAGMSVGRGDSAAPPSPAARTGAQQLRGAGAAAGAQGRSPLNGQVLNVGDGTVTVRLGPDQGSRIVLVAPSTRIVRTTETDVPLTDLKAGDRVTVVGQENSDGTVSAQAIVIGGANILQQLFGGGTRPSASPSPGR